MEGWDWRLLEVGLGRKLRMALLLRLFGWAGWGSRSFGRVGRRLDVGLIGIGGMGGVGEGWKLSNDAGELWNQASKFSHRGKRPSRSICTIYVLYNIRIRQHGAYCHFDDVITT
jgi:hypothetical protein